MPFYTTHRRSDRNILKYNNIVVKTLICSMGLSGMVFSAPALANVKSVGQDMLSVTQRVNPDYDPQGVRLGDFILNSGISAGGQYTDNVYATRENQVSDYLYTVSPDLSLRSDFARHSLSANVFAEEGTYKDEDTENYTDFGGTLSSTFDVTGQTLVPLTLSYKQDHIIRGAPDERAGSEPTVYKLLESTLGLIHQGRTLMMKMIAGIKDYTFDDVKSLFGNIDNSDQDRTEWSLYTSAGVQDEAVFAPFVYSELTKIDYDKATITTGLRRSSKGYEVGGGTVVNFSDITRAAFNIGYITREFDDPRLSTASGLAYGVNVIWEPSTLTSFSLEGKRTIQETVSDNASSAIGNSARLSVTYELFPNVLLRPSVGYNLYEYEGIDRNVEGIDGGVAMTYKLNQNLWLSTSYAYITQNESGQDAEIKEYKANTVNLSLKLQF